MKAHILSLCRISIKGPTNLCHDTQKRPLLIAMAKGGHRPPHTYLVVSNSNKLLVTYTSKLIQHSINCYSNKPQQCILLILMYNVN